MTAYTFNQIIDYTRTSAATYVANTGFVTQTPASRNLLLYTQEFDNAAWSKTNATALPFDPAMATLGSEVVANGDFSSSASWTAPASGASITGGALTFDGVTAMTSGSVTVNSVVTPIVIGRWYAVTFTIIGGTTNPVSVNLGGNVGTARSAAGTYTEYLFAIATTAVDVSTRGATGIRTGSIDNISVKEVIGGLITAPDGTLTGDALVATAGTAAHNIHQSGGGSGAAITMSIYAKAGTTSFVQLYHGAASTTFANFNLAAGAVGTVGAGATATITSVGNGWYRCTMTFTPGSASANRVAMISSATAAYNESWTATGTESILIWGAQLEAASAASTYTRNVGGLYPPRFDYDPVTLAPRGLLIEEQRTNLLLRSEEFDNASWGKARCTITANTATSPDGATDADKLVEDTASGTHVAYQASGIVSGVHTLSVYAKPAGRSWITFETDTANTRTFFDITNGVLGVIGSAVTASITPAGNGWYRCTITGTFTGNVYFGTASSNNSASYTGDGTSGIYLWGAQLEAGAFATSYIPTVASQVTRTADVATVTGANFSRWYNQSEGTFVVEASIANGGYDCFLATAYGAAGIGIRRHSSNTVVGYNRVGATNDVNGVGTFISGTLKAAYAIKSGDQAASLNGAAVATSTSTFTQAQTQLNIGFLGGGGGVHLNGHIRRVRYYPTRLANAQLQALTA